MAHPIDIDDLTRQIIGRLDAELGDDITKFVGFAGKQAKRLAKQAAWIAEASAKGELDDDDRNWFLDNLKELSTNFARTVAGLTLLTIEKAWNAVVDILWNAMSTVVGSTLPIPVPPSP